MNNASDFDDILIADDDHDDVHIFSLALTEVLESATLRHAEDGGKLFEELQVKIPDLLFLDINMPCKNGMDCIREIRQDKSYDTMPVVMFTSLQPREFVERTYRLGANFFIDKPTSVEALAMKISKVISIEWKKQMVYPSLEEYVI